MTDSLWRAIEQAAARVPWSVERALAERRGHLRPEDLLAALQAAGAGAAPEGARPDGARPDGAPALLDLGVPEVASGQVLTPTPGPLLIVTAATPEAARFPMLADTQVLAGPHFMDGVTRGPHGRLLTAATPEGQWDLEVLLRRLPPEFRGATLLVQADPTHRHRPRNLAASRGRRLLLAEATDGSLPSAPLLGRLLEMEPFDGLLACAPHPLLTLLGRLTGVPAPQLIPGLLGRFAWSGWAAREETRDPPAVALRAGAGSSEGRLEAVSLALTEAGFAPRRCALEDRSGLEALQLALAVVHVSPETAPDAGLLGMSAAGLPAFVLEPSALTIAKNTRTPFPFSAVATPEALVARLLAMKSEPARAAAEGQAGFEAWQTHGRLAVTRRALWGFVGGLGTRKAASWTSRERARLEHFEALRTLSREGPVRLWEATGDGPLTAEDLRLLPRVTPVSAAPEGHPSRPGSPTVAVLAASEGPIRALPPGCDARSLSAALLVPRPDGLSVAAEGLRALAERGFATHAAFDFVFPGLSYPIPARPAAPWPIDAPWLRPSVPVTTDAGAPGLVLKLYVDSTSLSVLHQMADFVRCERDPQVFKVITWRRSPLEPQALASSNAVYHHQNAQVMPDFLSLVAALATELRPARIEIFSNHIWAFRSVAPILRVLFARRLIDPSCIRLDLGDDGTWNLRDREALARLPDLADQLEAGARDLAAYLAAPRDPDELPAMSLSTHAGPCLPMMNHGWHRVLRTTYRALHPERFFDAVRGRLPDTRYEEATRPLRLDVRGTLTPQQWERYVALFDLTPELRARLGRLAASPESFVFLGSSTWDRAHNAALRDLQVSTIARLRADGVIPQGVGLAFKGHPANAEHEGAIMAALGDDVVHIPARIPLEVLEMDGILPHQVGGMLSTSFVTLTPGRVRFLVAWVSDPADLPLVEDVALFVSLGVVTLEQAHPWYT